MQLAGTHEIEQCRHARTEAIVGQSHLLYTLHRQKLIEAIDAGHLTWKTTGYVLV